MKRLLKYAGVLFFLGFGFSSCYKDVILPKTNETAPPQFVSYGSELQPLWTSNCASLDCYTTVTSPGILWRSTTGLRLTG